MKIKGLILAGGEGKRIGGKKPLRSLSGKPLIFWALSLHLKIGLEVLISIRDQTQEREIREVLQKEGFPIDRLQFVLDEAPFLGKGPLSGLYSAMKACREKTYLLTTAVDQPFLTEELLKELLTAVKKDPLDAVVYEVEGKVEPLPGIYSSELLEILEEFLKNQQKPSFKSFLNFIKSQKKVAFLDYPFKIENRICLFFNINSIEDLKKGEACFYHLKKLKE